MYIWREFGQNALASVGGVPCDDDRFSGKPAANKVDQLDRQVRPSSMIGVGVLRFRTSFFTLGHSLTIDIKPVSDRKRERFSRRPERFVDDHAKYHPIVAPTDEWFGFT